MIFCSTGVALLLAALPAPGAEPSAPSPRLDRDGVALPAGVLARMGSGRFRDGLGGRLRFTPDGMTLVSGGRGRLHVWDTATGRLKRRLDFGTDWAFGFALAGDSVAAAGANSGDGIVTVREFELATGKVRRSVRLPDRANVVTLAFSPGGDRVALSHGNTVRVYDTEMGRETLRLPAPAGFARDFAFTPDGKALAATDFSDAVRVYDAMTGKLLRELRHAGDQVALLTVSPDGRSLASIPWDEKRDPGECSVW